MVKRKDIRSMQPNERQKQLADLQMELMKANAQVSSGSAPKNPGQIREIKKSIARILTIEKELKNQEVGKKDE